LGEQLFVFRGDLLHGVLAPDEATAKANAERRSPLRTEADGDRKTLLFNWWTERPPGPADLPPCFAWGACGGGKLPRGTEQKGGLPPDRSKPTPAAAIAAGAPPTMRRLSAVPWSTARPFVSSELEHQLGEWRAQRLPVWLAEECRLPTQGGRPLVLAYGCGADGRACGGDTAGMVDNWTELPQEDS
jgi:hypothetical protein